MREPGARAVRADVELRHWLRLAELAVPNASPVVAIPRLRLLAAPALLVLDEAYALERKDAALLALLALDGPLQRARAATLLWPDADPQNARNSLRQRLFRLRRAVGTDIIEEDTALHLAAGVEHDLLTPSALFTDDTATAAGELLGAFSYEDCDELADWVRGARERVRSERRDAIAELAAREESSGHIARALIHGERLVAEDPLSEQAHRLVMRLHYRRGDRSAALAAYARCRQALNRELKAEPSAETRELAELIDRSGQLPGASSSRPVPAVISRPPLLIGRDREWRALEKAWAERKAALLIGDAGMGKTRLLSDFAGARTMPIASARPGDARVPYAMLTRVLRAVLLARSDHGGDAKALLTGPAHAELARVLPELGSPPSGALKEARFRQAVVDALTAHVALGCEGIALDDLHFADAATLELLPALPAAGVRLALAVRGAESPAALTAWRHSAGDSELVEIALQPLTEADVRALLDSLALSQIDAAALAAPLLRHTGGNPFFLLETVGALSAQGEAVVQGLPTAPSVGALLERRLSQISPAAQRLVRVAALAGVDFSAALAAAVLGEHPLDLVAAWQELEAAQIIRDESFAHDLILEATTRSVPRPIAQVLHGAIGAFLEEHHAPAARVAHHWFEANEWRKAAEQFNAAARVSFDASRFPEASQHFRSAAACFERAGAQPEQHTALQELAGCQIKAFDLTGARDVAEQLRRISVDDDQYGWALDRLIDTLNMGRQDDAAASAAAEEMRQRGQSSSNRWMEFNATRKLAITLAHRGRFDEAQALFGTQSDWIEANLHEWNVQVWLCDHAYVLDLSDRLEPAIEAYRRAESLARQHQNWWVVYVAMRNVALTSAWAGRLDVAVATSDDATNFSGRLGDALVERNPRDSGRRAALLTGMGRLTEALRLLEDARAILDGGGSDFWLAYCRDQLALLHVQLGQPARLGELPPQLPHLPPEAQMSRWIACSRVARALGQKAPPAPDAAQLSANGAACPTRWLLLTMLEGARGLAPDAAAQLCGRTAEQARGSGHVGIRLHALALGAACAAESGDADVAGHLAAESMTLARQFWPVGMSMAELMWGIHQGFTAAGNTGGSADALQRGAHWIENLALPHVPDAFRDSFLHRNALHRDLLAAFRRRR